MNNSNIQKAIEGKQGFKGLNLQGYFGNEGYTIQSYNTVIYSDKKGIDTKFYSKTTQKWQVFIAECFGLSFPKKQKKAVNGKDFQKLIKI